jgi:hypothetical protein
MNFFKKRKLKKLLKKTDYKLAKSEIIKMGSEEMVIKKDLATLLDSFIEKPCFETACKLIEYEPEFLSLFLVCQH